MAKEFVNIRPHDPLNVSPCPELHLSQCSAPVSLHPTAQFDEQATRTNET